MNPRDIVIASADHVIGEFSRDSLSPSLAATHRAGFGPQTRVLDGARADIAGQLERMGLQVVAGEPPPDDALLIVVTAPGRTAIVAALFERLGAVRVSMASRRGAPVVAPATAAMELPDIRVERGAGVTSEG